MSVRSIFTWQRAIYLLERCGSLIVQLLSGVLILRALGPSAFALYGTALGLGQIAATAARCSLDEMYAGRYAERGVSLRSERRVYVWRSAVAGLLAGLLWASTDAVAAHGVSTLLVIAAVGIVESFSLREVFLQTESRFRLLSVLGSTRTVVGFSVRAALIFYGQTSVLTMLAVSIVELLLFRGAIFIVRLERAQQSAVKPVRTALAVQDLIKYASVTALSLGYSRLDLFIGASHLQREDFGNYLAAQRFVEIYGFLAAVIGALMMPGLAKLSGRTAYEYALAKSLQLGGLGIVVVIFNLSVVSRFLPFITGPHFEQVDEYFVILSWGLVPLFFGLPLGRVALLHRMPMLMVFGGITSIVTSMTLFFSVDHLLQTGAALARSMVIGNVCGCVLVFVLVAAARHVSASRKPL